MSLIHLRPAHWDQGSKMLCIPDARSSGIFMLQTIVVGNTKLRLFYDTGCGDIVIKKSTVDALSRVGRALFTRSLSTWDYLAAIGKIHARKASKLQVKQAS